MKKNCATATVMIGMFIAAMENLIGSTVLPSIIASLGGIDLYPWIVSCFLLALVVTTPLFGKLADHFGFLKIYLIAIILFLTGSLFCGLSRTMPELIIARCIQGAGTSGLITLCILYVGIAYPPSIRHKTQALISAMWAIASLVGPALGAFIVTYFSWRIAFLINVPLSIAIFIAATFLLKDLPQHKSKEPFDLFGAALFTSAALAFLFAMVEIGKLQMSYVEVLSLFYTFITIIYLLYRSKHVKGSFISLDVVKNRPVVSTSIAIGSLGGAFLYASANFLPLFVQGAQGHAPDAVGKVITAMVLGTCAGSGLTAALLGRIGFRKSSLLGSFTLSIGLFLLTQITQQSSLWSLIIAGFFTGTGIGLAANGAIVASQSYSSPTRLGETSGLFSFFRSIGGMFAVSFLGSIQLSSFRKEVANRISDQVLDHPELILSQSDRSLLPVGTLETLSSSLAHSIHLAFLYLFPIVLIHFWLSSRMPKIRPHEIEKILPIESVGD